MKSARELGTKAFLKNRSDSIAVVVLRRTIRAGDEDRKAIGITGSCLRVGELTREEACGSAQR